jgi:hypothetical protein
VSITTPSPVRTLSWHFGLVIGAMWTGEVLLGNLGGTSIFGNLRDSHPRIYAMAGWFVIAAVAATLLSGIVVTCQTRSINKALQVGVWSGVISGVITCLMVGLNHIWIDPLLGLTFGGAGAMLGKSMRHPNV